MTPNTTPKNAARGVSSLRSVSSATYGLKASDRLLCSAICPPSRLRVGGTILEPMRRLLALALGLGLALGGSAVHAQQGPDRYDMLYGAPVDVTLNDLQWGAQSYDNRAIRTKGTVEIGSSTGRSRSYMIRDMGV